MKRYIALLGFLLISAFSFGQSTSPAGYGGNNVSPGTSPQNYFIGGGTLNSISNTYKFTGNSQYLNITDTSTVPGTDTIYWSPLSNNTYFQISVTDSVSLYTWSLKGASNGDVVIFDIVSPTANAGAFNFSTLFEVATGTTRLALTQSKRSQIAFRFNGAYYIEMWRNLNLTH